MALNVSEAQAVHTVLHWLGVPYAHGGPRPSDDLARAALQLLGANAYKTLRAFECRPDDIRDAVEHTAARLNRWADGQDAEEWRVVTLQNGHSAADQFYEIWSTTETFEEAEEDIRVAFSEGVWGDPHVQHRRTWASEWKRVEPS